MDSGPHIYQELSLRSVGLVLGVFLVAQHALMLWKPDWCQGWLKRLPRHYNAGVYMMGVGMLWFWLLVAPDITGTFSFLGALSMDLGEFQGMKPILRLVVPIAYVGLALLVKEFLFVRGLGLTMLMAAAPLLYAAFLKEPMTRLLVPLYAYGIIIAGLYFVGMPYLFRDAVNWVCAQPARWRALSAAGLAYGVAVLACALLFWGGF
ncbi:MAG: hypothetical protein ACQKBY_12855 [Verrucomicrobiales bacterium]